MSLGVELDGPRIVPYGQARTLTLDVYERSTNTQQTCTAATVRILLGGVEQLAEVAATALGPPATYSLLSTVFEETDLSDQYLEIWETTIGGQTEHFRVSGYVVRQEYRGTVGDSHLVQHYRKLARLRDADDTHFGVPIELAARHIERWMLRKERRPWLVFDNWALHEAHVHLALHYIFANADQELDDGTFEKRAKDHLDKFEAEMGVVVFRHDDLESGQIDDATVQQPTAGPMALSSGPHHRTAFRRAV